MKTLVLMAEEAHSESEGFPAVGWGISAFAILVVLLLVVLAFGRGRPHA
ncbi:hypothetical protein [Jiangella gansuensis]|nr:hypothetical protein [Jiangella gansuensis]